MGKYSKLFWFIQWREQRLITYYSYNLELFSSKANVDLVSGILLCDNFYWSDKCLINFHIDSLLRRNLTFHKINLFNSQNHYRLQVRNSTSKKIIIFLWWTCVNFLSLSHILKVCCGSKYSW